ncbi:VWA domain-containing protein [Tunturiibacter gelidiferens]|uniref:VWA domain-containing protein n=1 Tax=Tunturiibacter gelidiferens TaxID=3069689 RepID=UPI003D9B1559
MSGTTLAFVLCLGSSAFLGCFAEAQTAATSSDQIDKSDATLHAKAQLVEVDVMVTDRQGNPVHHLQESDFSVFEDKAQQTVKSFDEHETSGSPSPASSLPAGVFSNAQVLPEKSPVDVLLLDSLNTPSESQPYLRDQLVSYVVDHAKPGTRPAIFVLNTRLRMLQGLTSDPALLKIALMQQGVKFSPLLQRDLNDSPVHEISRTLTDIITSTPGGNALVAQVQSMMLNTDARMTSEKIQMRVQLSLSALDELSRYLAGIPGRKNLIWFSGAFPTTILRDAQTTGNEFAGNADMQDEVNKTLGLLARSRVAVSPVDARGLEPPPSASSSERGESPDTQQLTYGTTSLMPRDNQLYHDVASEHITMQEMAEATGGMALYNTNGLSNAIDKVIAAAHSYYTLSYTPPGGKRAGALREITVKLKQSGMHLAYRHEYSSDLTFSQSGTAGAMPPPGGSSAAVRASMAPYTADATEVLFEVSPRRVESSAAPAAASGAPATKWVGETAFEDGPHVQYTVTLNFDPKTVSFTESPDGKVHGVLDFILIIYDAKGRQIDSKLDRAVLDLEPARYKKLLSDGMRFRFNLVLPSQGDEILRFGVHDAVTDHIGTFELSADAIRGSGDTEPGKSTHIHLGVSQSLPRLPAYVYL